MVSKIAECVLKKVKGLQAVAGQNAMGVPHLLGKGALAVISEGIWLRGKKYTVIPVLSHCTARCQRKRVYEHENVAYWHTHRPHCC